MCCLFVRFNLKSNLDRPEFLFRLIGSFIGNSNALISGGLDRHCYDATFSRFSLLSLMRLICASDKIIISNPSDAQLSPFL